MTDVPKRLWADHDNAIPGPTWAWGKEPENYRAEDITEYVRKDISDELAEALEGLVAINDQEAVFGGWHIAIEKSRAALAKYKEAET